ncbi:RrF2 family transcriptional regulator [Candidatus Magnetominusculus xianensis]|uniref:Rrf2 family transcriptional regulator n=1 Tax=Candidatus Magnetominusculus xianensis TaxID=1748249 RepID=A0ABR5SGA5_9BACT|nr:Rrf2 family transcriptional regulator [Candidatus Magnetominusculus xianensis]KWT88357.1 Rrf2 family transcriptional regulator [Candidatus Magnetominusculus xianensis]MBF0405438.1 Rrf2 family transcriptional regulator [Nitrospirota bacterium]
MKINRDTDYAIRCVLLMSGNPEKTFVIGEMAKEKAIPESFLAKILQKLTRAGILRSIRGANGGFVLIKSPQDINLLDIVEAINGKIVINRCTTADDRCVLIDDCPTFPIWLEIRQMIEERLRHYEFATLVSKYKNSITGITPSGV